MISAMTDLYYLSWCRTSSPIDNHRIIPFNCVILCLTVLTQCWRVTDNLICHYDTGNCFRTNGLRTYQSSKSV